MVIKNKLVLRNHFPWPICNLLHKHKEHLAFKENIRVTKKFLITKFDCIKVCQSIKKRFPYSYKIITLWNSRNSGISVEVRMFEKGHKNLKKSSKLFSKLRFGFFTNFIAYSNFIHYWFWTYLWYILSCCLSLFYRT